MKSGVSDVRITLKMGNRTASNEDRAEGSLPQVILIQRVIDSNR